MSVERLVYDAHRAAAELVDEAVAAGYQLTRGRSCRARSPAWGREGGATWRGGLGGASLFVQVPGILPSLMPIEEGLHLLAQARVLPAGPFEPGLAPLGVEPDDLGEEALDLPPALAGCGDCHRRTDLVRLRKW